MLCKSRPHLAVEIYQLTARTIPCTQGRLYLTFDAVVYENRRPMTQQRGLIKTPDKKETALGEETGTPGSTRLFVSLCSALDGPGLCWGFASGHHLERACTIKGQGESVSSKGNGYQYR